MKNKFFLFLWSSLFIGSFLVSLHAMPPKPLPKGKGDEKTEEEKEAAAKDFEEQGKRLKGGRTESFSSSVERGVMKTEGQKEGEEISLDCSAEGLEKELQKALAAQRYWSAEQNKISNVDRTISASQAEEILLVLGQQLNYWMTQQEKYEQAVEEGPELEETVTPLIEACEETLKVMQEVQRLLDKTKEMELNRVPAAGMEGAESEFNDFGFEKVKRGSSLSSSMEKLSLKESSSSSKVLKEFATQQSFSEKASIFQFHGLSLPQLKSTAKSLIKQAEKLRDGAKEEYDSACRAHVRNQFDRAIKHYNNAIELAQQTASAYTETEQVHLQLKAVGADVRQWGMHLKKTWARYQAAWQSELRLLIQKIKMEEQKKNRERTLEGGAKAQRELATALQQRDLADQEERSEIGETWDAIARRLTVIQNHFGRAQEAYERGDEAIAKSFEQKIATLEARNETSKQLLSSLETAMEIWKRAYSTEASRYLESREEELADGTKKISLIYKRRFVGPLLRIERRIAANGEILQETKMAAEYLMVKLNGGNQRDILLEKLRESFPNNHLTLEEVAPEQSLYRLNFKPSASAAAAAGSTDLLTLFDQIKKTIEEKSLALDCYPSTLIELAFSKISETAKKEVNQPWWLHSPFGINPPSNLFDETDSIVGAEAAIRIAVLDSGIRESHQAFKNKIVLEEDDEGETSYGYNACAIHPDQKGLPRDNTGHGTHVAGIIVGLPHDVEEVEVKRKKNSKEEPTIFDLQKTQPVTIRGVASMPHVAELLICKHMEPGQTEGFVDRALECVRYAREHGARIINCSWGGARDDEGELSQKNLESLKQALSNPYEILTKEEQGEWSSYNPSKFAPPALVVIAAGNLRPGQDSEKLDKDVYPSYPASLSLPNAIAVAATRKDGNLADFSYYGKESIQIAAPGAGIISASYMGDALYRKLPGTSMAAPQVAAAAAWIMKKFNLSPQKIVEHLGVTADKEAPALAVASGRLDLARALNEGPTSLETEQELEIEKAQKKSEEERRLSLEKKMEKQKNKEWFSTRSPVKQRD